MNILVTGVSKGVGLEIIIVLLGQGHVIYGVSRSKTDEIADLLSKYPNNYAAKPGSTDDLVMATLLVTRMMILLQI